MPRAAKRDKIPIGTVLGQKYRVSREIGRGGMAAVYEAVNIDIGKHVAVKVLNPEYIHSTVVVERFFREARAAAAVKSPYICDVYDAGRLQDDRPFLVLELLHGESLYERMVKLRRIPPENVVSIFHDVCRGLAKAHEANIIHRDLKPENIFITKTDEGKELAKILDFGLAKFYESVDGTEQQQRLTREGAVFGTPAYMSPEQVKGQGQVDHRADLWAAGCMVYESLIGRTVWDTNQGVAMTFAQIATAEIPRPSEKLPSLPKTFDAWFFKALARNPDERFQTALEFWEALDEAFRQPSKLVLTPEPSPASGEVEPDPEEHVPESTIPESSPAESAKSPPSGKASQAPSSDNYAEGSGEDSGEQPSQFLSTAAAPRHVTASSDNRPRVLAAAGGALAVLLIGMLVWVLGKSDEKGITSPAVRPSSRVSSVQSGRVSNAASASASAKPLAAAPKKELSKWERQVREAQQALRKQQVDKAIELLRAAFDGSASPVASVMMEDIRLAKRSKGDCKLEALGRPRPFDMTDGIRRPCVTSTPRGAVVAWVDNHESTGQWHVYTQLLDDALRSIGSPVDVTPEASFASTPRFYVRPEHLLLLYSDTRERPGVYLRRLSISGRISGPPMRVTKTKDSTYWPTLAVGPLGDYWIAYGIDRDRAPAARLYLQHVTPNIRVSGKPSLIAEFASTHGLHRSRARAPVAVFSGNTLQVAYRLRLGQQAAIVRQSLIPDERGLFESLSRETHPKRDRVVGERATVSDHGGRLKDPSMACDSTGCFIAWSNVDKGLIVAFVDSTTGTTIWRKMFARKGSGLMVQTDGKGGALLSWYQASRVHVAPVSKDGIGNPSVISRVTGDQPRPSISPTNRRGTWLVSWTDYEAGHLEVYVARAVCHH